MLGGGEHPPRALKLVDPAQPLHPGRVDEILFCRTASHTARSALGDAKVSVDWIAGQIHARVLGACLIHEPIIAMSSLLAEGGDLFNAGRYWEAHEAWEREWTPDRKGSDSGFYKGLIQVAAGCLHYSQHNRRGAINKWRSGADYLRPFLPRHNGLDLEPLVRAADTYLEAISGEAWPDLPMPIIRQE